MKIYVAHPYGGKEENKKIVEEFIKKHSKETGETFISPIHSFGYLYKEIDYEMGIYMCLDLLETCDAVVIKPLEEIKHSKGCLIEYGYARGKRIPMIDWHNFKTLYSKFFKGRK